MDPNNLQSEDVQLLEDCWFFGNSLHTKPNSRMLRSYSDPCSSSNFPGNSYEETFESIEKLPLPQLDRTAKGRRSNRKAASKGGGLDRAPSLPASLESTEEEEIEFSMGKLIRQASLNHSDNRPPRKAASKVCSRLRLCLVISSRRGVESGFEFDECLIICRVMRRARA